MTTMTTGPYWGQPGFENDAPAMDTEMLRLHDALKALSPAALSADDPDEAEMAREHLSTVEEIRFGFPAGSDIARALVLLAAAIERKAAEATP